LRKPSSEPGGRGPGGGRQPEGRQEPGGRGPLAEHVERALNLVAARRDQARSRGVEVEEIGVVARAGQGVASVTGLPGARLDELLTAERGGAGLAFDLEPGIVGYVTLRGADLQAGDEVRRTGRVLDVPVGEGLLGRVVDPLGAPLDGGAPPEPEDRWPVERPAPPIMHRDPVAVPLATGIKVVDALVPVGRGQRELILGDRQTGKTAVAVDTIINQRDSGVLAVYCAIGQSSAATARIVETLRERGALEHVVVVVAPGEAPPGLQYVAPYAATSIGEYFMGQGRDVVIVYDDLSKHARAYRELSLLLRRPPGREAFPGDIFYIHARLLERSTRLRAEHGGGSLTALPIVETEAQNISAYIPTNVISITDGQIYLSPELFRLGVMPAVDVGRSVSRVGGKAQLPAYSQAASTLRLTYSQFVELEAFARFGTRLDPETRRRLDRGQRVREVLKQPQFEPVGVVEQIAAVVALNEGLFDAVPVESVTAAELVARRVLQERLPETAQRILERRRMSDGERSALLDEMRDALVREGLLDAVSGEAAGSGGEPGPHA